MDRAASESEIILQKMKEQLLNGDHQKNKSKFSTANSQIHSIFIPYYGVHPNLRLVMGRSWMSVTHSRQLANKSARLNIVRILQLATRL